MTECSTQLTLFPLPKKPVLVRNDGGALTSDAGVLLLREIDERLRLTERLASCVVDRREPAKVQHSILALLRQRTYQMLLCEVASLRSTSRLRLRGLPLWDPEGPIGVLKGNDADTLRSDPALKLAVGRAPTGADLASQPTLSRLENAVAARECWRISEVLIACYLERHRKRPPSRIVLDVDATDDETHGHQQLSFFHGFYYHHCYLPLLVFAQAEGKGEQELVAAMLRPGNVHAGFRAMAILRQVVKRLRAAFPRSRIELRADSGLALPQVYEGCEQIGLPYTVSLPKNERLKAMAEPWRQEARALYTESRQKAQVFGEFRYAAESWETQRRVIVKAEVMEKGENPRFVVTNRAGTEPEELYRFYCQRGDPENRIKELKDGLRADRLSCHRFWANQFRLLLHAAAYLLMQAMRAMLAGTELACAQVNTLRLRLLKVGARIKESARRVWVHLPSAYPWAYLWPQLARAGPA